jgi:hypothetical protein
MSFTGIYCRSIATTSFLLHTTMPTNEKKNECGKKEKIDKKKRKRLLT